MTAEEFVDAIREHVMDSSVTGVIKVVSQPPGRSPGRDLLELSAWFNSLPERDREMVQRMLAHVAHAAVFGLFAVLDGSRTVAAYEAPSDHFELRHFHGTDVDVLSGPKGKVLHELL